MSIVIEPVVSKRDIKKFIKFQLNLYKDNPYFVPPLVRDEIETFSKDKNPAHDDGDSKLFLAYKDGVIAGRIAGILSNPINRKYGLKDLHFSWYECIDDYEVSSEMFNAVEMWGKELGMETLSGPHGFCDFDPQGLLIEGFDKIATIATFYNHPYYKDFIERYGFNKEVDYVEYWTTVPVVSGLPGELERTSEWIRKRYNYKILDYKSVKEYAKRGRELFKLLEDTFIEIYGTSPLTEKQIQYYTKKYISYINKNLVKIVVDDSDEMIGFLLTMPSLSKAFQKAKGRLLPFGIFYIMKALKTYDVLDFYFAGVKKQYRGKGVDVLMSTEIVRSAIAMGFKHAESNQELENNTKVQALWKFFNPVLHKRRRIYKKTINYER